MKHLYQYEQGNFKNYSHGNVDPKGLQELDAVKRQLNLDSAKKILDKVSSLLGSHHSLFDKLGGIGKINPYY